MDTLWWQMPGPARYLDGVVDDLRNGKNVVLSFPAFPLSSIAEPLRGRVRESDRRWKSLNASELPSNTVGSLAEALFERLAPSSGDHEPRSIPRLASSLDGVVIWVDKLTAQNWRTWSDFLSQYQHACQALPEWNRGLFCVSTCGFEIPNQFADVALSIHRWEGVVRRLDMLLFLDRILPTSRAAPLHRHVALAVATELAGSDPELGRRLVQLDLQRLLLVPQAPLVSLAADRGWDKSVATAPTWASGITDTVEGIRMVHSSAVVLQGDLQEIQHRIWRGQVTVLFAFVEEARRKILPQVSPYLHLPIETTYGMISDASELEIGQLRYFLRSRGLPRTLSRQLTLLTDIRHTLAHLRPVSYESLSADELFCNIDSADDRLMF